MANRSSLSLRPKKRGPFHLVPVSLRASRTGPPAMSAVRSLSGVTRTWRGQPNVFTQPRPVSDIRACENLTQIPRPLCCSRCRETHYLKSDDVHIAYQVFGDGSLTCCSFRGSFRTSKKFWESPDHCAFFRRLASFFRLYKKSGPCRLGPDPLSLR